MSDIVPGTYKLFDNVYSREIDITAKRSKCLKYAAISLGLAFIGWAYFPIVNIQDYSNSRSPWTLQNNNIAKLILDCALLFLTSSFMCLCATVKYLAGAVLHPGIAYKTPLSIVKGN